MYVFFRFVRLFFVFFFFKQKTAYEMRISDWSSDVCSSDLRADLGPPAAHLTVAQLVQLGAALPVANDLTVDPHPAGVDGLQVVDAPQKSALPGAGREIGRASCRERVCQYV